MLVSKSLQNEESWIKHQRVFFLSLQFLGDSEEFSENHSCDQILGWQNKIEINIFIILDPKSDSWGDHWGLKTEVWLLRSTCSFRH